jgi:Asp/Glu/hydantoin racemase
MMFSISVVASLPGSDLTVTVEAKQLQADGRGSIRMLGGGLLQKLGNTMKKTVDIPMVDHVIQYSLPAITKNRPPKQ